MPDSWKWRHRTDIAAGLKRVIFDRVQRGLSIGSFRFAPRADIPGKAGVDEYTP
jgi:hypothetical protein